MTVIIRKDLFGSTQTDGIVFTQEDRATRRFMIKNLSDTLLSTSHLQAAIDEAVAAAGLLHHNNTAMPLRTAKAVKFGLDHALVELKYRRNRLRDTSGALTDIASFNTIGARIPWYFRRGTFSGAYPIGDVNVNDPTKQRDSAGQQQVPLDIGLTVPTLQMYVPFRLSSGNHPYTNNFDLINTVNELAVTSTVTGLTLAIGEIVYLGAKCDLVIERSATGVETKIWDGVYSFQIRDAGFKTMKQPEWRPDLSSGRWEISSDNALGGEAVVQNEFQTGVWTAVASTFPTSD